MSKARLTDWYIPKNPILIWEYYEHTLEKEKHLVNSIKSENNKKELIEQLQISSFVLYSAKYDLLEYVQYNKLPIDTLDLMKSVFFELNEQMKVFENNIIKLGDNVDLKMRKYGTKLKRRHEAKSLTGARKVKLLANAAEIKKEFLDFIKKSDKVQKRDVSFISMFTSQKDCADIESLLEQNEYIRNEDGKLIWEPSIATGNNTPHLYLAFLLLTLEEKNYLKKDMFISRNADALSNHFSFNLSSKTIKKAIDQSSGKNGQPNLKNTIYFKSYSAFIPDKT